MGDIVDHMHEGFYSEGLCFIPYKRRKHFLKTGDKCPKCDGILVTRINKKTNDQFLGCSKFPDCKFSQ